MLTIWQVKPQCTLLNWWCRMSINCQEHITCTHPAIETDIESAAEINGDLVDM